MPTESLIPLPEWPAVRLAVRVTRLDLRPSAVQPSLLRTVAGVVAGVVLSLGVNWLLVRFAMMLFPGLAGFPHFQLSDFGRLTVIGALIACVGWPILTRLSSSPGWIYAWCAALGTLVLWLPDLYIWGHLHEPGRAVMVLGTMHVAVVVVSCLSMVVIAGMPGRAASAPD